MITPVLSLRYLAPLPISIMNEGKVRHHMPWGHNIAITFRLITIFVVMLTLNACGGAKTKISIGLAAGSSTDPTITETAPAKPKAGDTVTLAGKRFPTRAKNLVLKIVLTSNDTKETDLTITNANSASFTVPSDISLDIKSISIIHEGKALTSFELKDATVYTLDPVTFTPAAGIYAEAQSVTIASPNPDTTIYYTTDGSTPTKSSAIYTTAISVVKSQTLTAYAVRYGFNDSPSASAAYVITGAVATPVFSLAAGAYGPTQILALSTATAGATIYYTTDGSTPNTGSSVYSSAITLSSSQTIKAFATKNNYLDSAVASAAYTINGNVATPTFSPAAGP